MESKCLFENLYLCSKKDPLSQASTERIIRASKQYEDGLHMELEQYQDGEVQTVAVHRKCVDKYCHKKVIQKTLRDKEKQSPSQSDADLTSAPKRARRSEHKTFVFLQHCLFCGETCEVVKDPKHPDRWHPAFICRQGETYEGKSLRDAVFEACKKRKDRQSEEIMVRLAGVLSDFHAANVRYHVDCKATFLSPKSIQAAANKSSQSTEKEPTDPALDSVLEYMAENKASIFNSIDIYTRYVEQDGNALSRRQLTQKVLEHFGGDLVVLSSPGMASIFAFQSYTAKILHLMPDDTDDIDRSIEKVAKQIKAEIADIETDRSNYHSHISKDICSKFQSDTLCDVLSKVSQKLNQTLPALLIGTIVTSVVQNLATPLQIALAVLLRDSKEHVKAFNDFGVTCSYDELLRFKKSVASAAHADLDLSGLKSGEDCLVQGVGDNFDQQISSQNGKVQTHSMALLMTQTERKGNQSDAETLIPRLSKSEMTKEIPYECEVSRYTGQKKTITARKLYESKSSNSGHSSKNCMYHEQGQGKGS